MLPSDLNSRYENGMIMRLDEVNHVSENVMLRRPNKWPAETALSFLTELAKRMSVTGAMLIKICYFHLFCPTPLYGVKNIKSLKVSARQQPYPSGKTGTMSGKVKKRKIDTQ